MGMANKFFLPANLPVMDKLAAELGDDEHLLLVGCNDRQMRHFKNHRRVTTVGFMTERKKLAETYNMADVFLNLTFEDTLPTVNMESICCGTPVVAYDSCGSPELIESGKSGYVVPQLDHAALRAAVDRIKENLIVRGECAKIGRNRFDKDDNYRSYVELYEKILMK